MEEREKNTDKKAEREREREGDSAVRARLFGRRAAQNIMPEDEEEEDEEERPCSSGGGPGDRGRQRVCWCWRPLCAYSRAALGQHSAPYPDRRFS